MFSAVVLPHGCAQNHEAVPRIFEPDGYVYLDGRSNWGHKITLRIVDWGEPRIHISVRDDYGRSLVGHLTRDEYRRLITDLTSQGIFELKPFPAYANDAVWYTLDIRSGPTRHKLRFMHPFHGEQPHADVLERLYAASNHETLDWEAKTRGFRPDQLLVDTGPDPIADLYFDASGELHYATLEYSWDGEARSCGDDPDAWGCVTWHTVGQPGGVSLPFHDEPNCTRIGPCLPRPHEAAPYVPDQMPWMERVHRRDLLAQPRIFANGRIAVYLHRTREGSYLKALDTQNEGIEVTLVALPWVFLSRKRADIAPDGSRAAWIDNRQLSVSDLGVLDEARIVEAVEGELRYRRERDSK